jgi:hypothetical protein
MSLVEAYLLLQAFALAVQVIGRALRSRTDELSSVYWDACVYPGGKQST